MFLNVLFVRTSPFRLLDSPLLDALLEADADADADA